MKKTLRNLSLVVLVLALVGICSSVVFAKSAIETAADKAQTQFADSANYWGYEITDVKTTSKNSSKLVRRFNAKCSLHWWLSIEQITTKTDWSGYVTKWKYRGNIYDLKTFKGFFEKYPGSVLDIKARTKERATAKGDLILKKARSNKWTILSSSAKVTSSGSSAKNLVATATARISVRNKKYAFPNEVIVVRKNGKFAYTYKRNNAKVSKIDLIYDWLTRFKVG